MSFFSQPCEFPRVSGHPLHHGMTNQNGQGQVLGGQAPSESARLGAKQGHAKSAKAATNNHSPSLTSSQNRKSNIKNQKSFPSRPWREQSVSQSPITNLPSQPASAPRACPDPAGALVGALRPLRAKARPGTAGRDPSAFSLTEVVIAMGVAAVAFTSIIALFPLGLNMSKESYEATQAALIAQTIMADLNDATSTKVITGDTTNYAKLIQIKGDTFAFDDQNYTKINLSGNTSNTFYLAYDETVRPNSTLKPILIRPSAFSTAPSAFYTDGTNGAFAVVKVIISQTFLLGSDSSSNPQKIDVWVETPGKFRDTNRVQFLFTGVIPQS